MPVASLSDSTLVVRAVETTAVDALRLERDAVSAARSLERWLVRRCSVLTVPSKYSNGHPTSAPGIEQH